MKELLIVISTTLIPALITLITIIFSSLTKYKKEILLAQKDTKELHSLIEKLEQKLLTITNEKIKLEKENENLKERIKELELKVAELEKLGGIN